MVTKMLQPITTQANVCQALAVVATEWREAAGDPANAKSDVGMLLFDVCLALGLTRSEMVTIFGETQLNAILDRIY